MNKISSLILNKNWGELSKQYEPKILAQILSIKEGKLLAHKLLFNEERDDSLREYAVELLEEIRNMHSKEWLEDWKNDVFLGDACYMTLHYNERYQAYKRAYEKAKPIPPSLLISIASCYLSPTPPISIDEAERFAKLALEREMSIEGVILLRGIYAEKKDKLSFDYWDKVLKEIEHKKMHSSSQEVWPDMNTEES